VIVVANHMPADEEDKFEAARNQTLSIVCPPWAAQVAFVSTFVSAMYGFNYIAVGNERSANEGNGTVYLGAEVNHQVCGSQEVSRACHSDVIARVNAASQFIDRATMICSMTRALHGRSSATSTFVDGS